MSSDDVNPHHRFAQWGRGQRGPGRTLIASKLDRRARREADTMPTLQAPALAKSDRVIVNYARKRQGEFELFIGPFLTYVHREFPTI
jgi:hypothetical protein